MDLLAPAKHPDEPGGVPAQRLRPRVPLGGRAGPSTGSPPSGIGRANHAFEPKSISCNFASSESLTPEGVVTEPSRRRRLLILAICCMSLVIVGLDNTIVNVALPSIQRELHAPVSGLQWVVDAYTLVLASLLVLSGSTADRLGRRSTFQAGLA